MKRDDILFLEPVFMERIWGGRALEDKFGYDIPAGNIGECWGISAHPNGESVIRNGEYKGLKLSELWESHKELFGGNCEGQFPLLVKVLDADADLSVQVHPDDAYAAKFENGELGKTECWYVVDCNEDAEIVFGHNAKSSDEMHSMIENGSWDKFLQRRRVKAGDFFYVPAGTVHALCKGALILEVQQSSDTTYRLYDYDRRDDAGNLRELHIEKSLDVITVPHVDPANSSEVLVEGAANITKYVDDEFFAVYKYDIDGNFEFSNIGDYSLVSVTRGEGTVNDVKISKGEHFIVPTTTNAIEFSGELELIIAHP